MSEIINKNLIKLDIKSGSREEVINQLSNLINGEGRLNNFKEYVEEVFRREELSTTGIGFGIAIPHGKCKAVDIPTVALGRVSEGVEWESLDDKPVYLVFLLAVPEAAASDQHLKILAALSRKLINDEFRNELLNSDNEENILQLLAPILANI